MSRFGAMLISRGKFLLENKQQAIWWAVIFSVLPFAAWLSVTLVALVTLRKGAKAGGDVLLPVFVMHTLPMLMLMPLQGALINTLITYIPCYVAAITLRNTMRWQYACGAMLLVATLIALGFQWLMPDFIGQQFQEFATLLIQYHGIANLRHARLDASVWPQLFFGVQIVTAAIMAVISLLCARGIQAKLFMPGGLAKEWMAFRAGKKALLLLVCLIVGAYYESALAFNLLPVVICYFLVAGFNVIYVMLARKRPVRVAVLLLLIVFIKPPIILFVYVIAGALDSVFNFRMYLPARVKEIT